MTIDLLEFRDKFVEDSTDLLKDLEEDVLSLEDNRSNDELIQSVFRAMHTLKGVAGMYGFDEITTFTHALENIYDDIRNGAYTLSDAIFNITFEAVDHLRNLLSDPDFDIPENKLNQEKLLNVISNIETSSNTHKTEQQTVNKRKEHTDKNTNTYYILFHSKDSFVKRGIRILNIFEELSALGEIKFGNKLIYENDETNEKEEHWEIYLATDKGIDAIEDVFMFVIDDCKITKISNNDILEKAENSILQLKEQANNISILDEVERLGKGAIENTKTADLLSQKNDTPTNPTEDSTTNTLLEETTKQLKPSKRIAVDAAKLDHLMYLVGELITVNSQLGLSTDAEKYEDIKPYLKHVNKLSKLFRNNALELRLVPIQDMAVQLKRLVRDLSKQLNKDVDFQVQGGETELDKSTVNILAEPLMHIIRNCLDHGIETADVRKKLEKPPKGQINFFAFHQGNNVFINIQDDGAGIDPDKIRKKAIENGFIQADAQLTKTEIYDLIFLPGFSTAKNLTQVSGRGVGMDVVKSKISEVRGEVEITSEVGLGTSFTIKLQQSISILDTMLIKVADLHYMIPLADVEVCNQQAKEEIESRKNTKTLNYRNNLIPFIDLYEITDLNNKINDLTPKVRKIIIINKQDKRIALIADQIIGEHQAVLKPLGRAFKAQKLISSASILAGGEMAFMLNTIALQKMTENKSH